MATNQNLSPNYALIKMGWDNQIVLSMTDGCKFMQLLEKAQKFNSVYVPETKDTEGNIITPAHYNLSLSSTVTGITMEVLSGSDYMAAKLNGD